MNNQYEKLNILYISSIVVLLKIRLRVSEMCCNQAPEHMGSATYKNWGGGQVKRITNFFSSVITL